MNLIKGIFYGLVVCMVGVLFVLFMDSTFVANVISFDSREEGIIVFAIIYLAGVIAACTSIHLCEKNNSIIYLTSFTKGVILTEVFNKTNIAEDSRCRKA